MISYGSSLEKLRGNLTSLYELAVASSGPDEDTAVEKLAKKTEELWHQFTPFVADVTGQLNRYLIEECNGNTQHEGGISKASQALLDIYYGVYPFFDEARKRTHPSLQTLVRLHFCKDCFRHIDKLKIYRDVISMKAKTFEKIPLKAIKDLSIGAPLKKIPEEQLKEWIQLLVDKSVSSGMLFKCLQSIVEHMQATGHYSNPLPHLGKVLEKMQIAYLELYPNHHQEFLSAPDFNYLIMRGRLAEGTVLLGKEYVHQNGSASWRLHEITLGKPLNPKHGEFDNNLYFSIKEYYKTITPLNKDKEEDLDRLLGICPKNGIRQKSTDSDSWLVWIPKNPAIAEMRNIWYRQGYQYGFPLAALRLLSPDGDFALVEKLPVPLSQISKEHLEGVIAHLKYLLSQKIMPDIPDIRHLFYCPAEKVIKANISIVQENFSIKKFESFIYKISKSQSYAFKKIIYDTGLFYHRDAAFIREGAKQIFNCQFSLDEHIKLGNFSSDEVVDDMHSLRTALNGLYISCYEKIIAKREQALLTTAERISLKKIFLQTFLDFSASTFVWPTLDEVVMGSKFVKSLIPSQ